MTNARVVAVSASAKTLTLGNGESVAFDKAFVATGAVARRLTVPGADLHGVFTLRVPEVGGLL